MTLDRPWALGTADQLSVSALAPGVFCDLWAFSFPLGLLVGTWGRRGSRVQFRYLIKVIVQIPDMIYLRLISWFGSLVLLRAPLAGLPLPG